MSTIADRIRQLIEEAGVNSAQYAKMVNMDQSSLSKLLSGKIKSIRPRVASEIEKNSGISQLWILTGEGPKFRDVQISDNSGVVGNVVSGRLVQNNVHIPNAGDQKIINEKGEVRIEVANLRAENDGLRLEIKSLQALIDEKDKRIKALEKTICLLEKISGGSTI